jgi:hypothetical protein
MLEPLVVRVFAARRAALLSRLTGGGMAQDVAEEWLAAYGGAGGRGRHLARRRRFWQQGGEWIEA